MYFVCCSVKNLYKKATGMTRFGKIWPLLKKIKNLKQFLKIHFEPFLAIFYAVRQIFIVVNNLAIWSHWTSDPQSEINSNLQKETFLFHETGHTRPLLRLRCYRR